MTMDYSYMNVPPPYTAAINFPSGFELGVYSSINYPSLALLGNNNSYYNGAGALSNSSSIFTSFGRLATGNGTAADKAICNSSNPFVNSGGFNSIPQNYGVYNSGFGNINDMAMFDLYGILQSGFGNYLI